MHRRLASPKTGNSKMNAIGELLIGVALGLFYFGGLWLTLRYGLRAGTPRVILMLSGSVRLIVLALGFAALSLEGIGALLFGLLGFLLARTAMLYWLGGRSHGT